MEKDKYIIRLYGKASQVFYQWDIIYNDLKPGTTLGELAKELK